MTSSATTTESTMYAFEATHMLNGKPAGFAGYFRTRDRAEALRRHSQLSVAIKRVRIPASMHIALAK